VGLSNEIVSGPDEGAVSEGAAVVAGWLRELIAARPGAGGEIIGPAPAPLQRIKGRWRWHMLLRSGDRRWLGKILRYASARHPLARSRGSVRVVIDRDPVALL
jgi:primosomal protein N' (replication factor Y)